MGAKCSPFAAIDKRDNALTVPLTAIVRDGSATYCCTVDSGKINRKKVDLGLRTGTEVEIHSGLTSDDMIAAIHRNSGGTRFGFVNWSAGSHGHAAAAYFDHQDSQPRTLVIDGMSGDPQPETWPDAYFNGHAWPPGFNGNPPPYSVELMARGIDNYIWLEGYLIRGPNAGTLLRAAVPYLPAREKSDQQKVFAGPYPR